MTTTTTTKADLFTGIFVPRQILEDKRLNASIRILFGLLDGLAKTEAGCYASNRYLAQAIGVKPRQVRNLISKLEEFGYVTRSKKASKVSWKMSERIIQTVTSNALEKAKVGVAMDCHGGRQWIATNSKLNNHNPLNPLKRGKGKTKLGKGDYSNGF